MVPQNGRFQDLFEQKLLPKYPPVFYDWFMAQFPDPSDWYRARQRYTRTAAVMSMVGYVIGLGDRHCENIMFDHTTGDTVHVDFNCLFNKGENFSTPERVPFRLTGNMVHAMGVTGCEGTFRAACEATLGMMRQECDTLVSVLNTFAHDPIIDWSTTRGEAEAKKVMLRMEKRLKGQVQKKQTGLPLSVAGQVHNLINEATSSANLSVMYIGWASHM